MYCFQDDDFYFIWKPNGIASTFGKEKSFLEIIFYDKIKNLYISAEEIEIINTLKYPKIDLETVISVLSKFGEDKEYGLLNRLDNDTGGLLYFAKTERLYENYKKYQDDGLIDKYYVADTYGNITQDETIIDYPIMHHKSNDDRMIAIKSTDDKKNSRGKEHFVKTTIRPIQHSSPDGFQRVSILIKKGIRHQIRVHLSSIGAPIVGDKVYCRNKSGDFLHLWSVGAKIRK